MSFFQHISSTSGGFNYISYTSGGFKYIKYLVIDYIIEPFNNLFNTNLMDDSLIDFT